MICLEMISQYSTRRKSLQDVELQQEAQLLLRDSATSHSEYAKSWQTFECSYVIYL